MRQVTGFAACLIALVGLGIAAYLQFGHERRITDFPDVRVTVPFLVATLGLAIASFVRRETAWQLPVVAIAMSAASLAIGWLVVVTIVAGATLLVILALHKFF